MTKSFIFDFDGTLVNSEKTIRKCFYEITNSLSPDRLNFVNNIVIGPPLEETAKYIIGNKNSELIDKFIKNFINLHDEKLLYEAEPYPLVNSTLKELHNKKIPMAIATNKRKEPTLKLIEYFGWKKFFKIIKSTETSKKKNKTTMINEILSEEDTFKKSYFIGDTIGDYIAASQNGLKFIRAKYGYGINEKWKNIEPIVSIEKFEELINI